MHAPSPSTNVILCGHADHIPFGTQLCDHFSWHLHTHDQITNVLQHVTDMPHAPDLIMWDMHVTPLDQVHSASLMIKHLCMFKWGKSIPMCAWMPESFSKEQTTILLNSAIHCVIPVQEFTHMHKLASVLEHTMQGHAHVSDLIKHVIRNAEHMKPSKALMLCASMCEPAWQIHYELLKQSLPIHMHVCASMMELLHTLLTQPDATHRVVLDAHTLLNTPHMSMWELLNCVQSTHASVSADSQKKLPIYVMVDCDADITQIRQIMASNLVQGLMPAPDAHTTYEHMRNAVYDQIRNKYHVPDRLQKRLDAKKTRPLRRSRRVTLTPREQQIVDLVCDKGYSNKTIALQLQITESTVKLHLGNILKKMHLRNRTQLAVYMKSPTRV